MPFTRPDLTSISSRIETDITSRLTSGAALLRVMFLKVLARALAGAAHTLHGHADFLSKMLFVVSAEAEFLEKKATERGLTRTAAVKATGSIQFTGTNGTSITSGTRVQDANGVEYITDSTHVISSGVANINATCSLAGAVGNIPVSSAMSLLSPIAGISASATSYTAFTGGSDVETDTALRSRILFNIQNPGNGGNIADYENWSREVAGVERAWVFPNNLGPGTVGVVITALGSDPLPSGGLVDSVQANIDTKKPVTAEVTVSPIVKVNFRLTVAITPYNTTTIAALKASLATLLEAESAPGGTILLSHIRDAIMNAGLSNYSLTGLYAGGSVSIADIVSTGFNYLVPDDTNYTITEL